MYTIRIESPVKYSPASVVVPEPYGPKNMTKTCGGVLSTNDSWVATCRDVCCSAASTAVTVRLMGTPSWHAAGITRRMVCVTLCRRLSMIGWVTWQGPDNVTKVSHSPTLLEMP